MGKIINYKLLLLLLVIFIHSVNGFSQEEDLTLPVYKITINSSDLNSLNASFWLDEYYNATFSFGALEYPCRVKYRGGTSLYLPKKNWKIMFEDDNNIFNAEKINLNAEYRDKSYIRNYLTMKYYKSIGFLCSETDMISLFVNNNYFGVYVQVETVDQNFLEKRDLPANELYKGVGHGSNFAPCFSDLTINSWETKISKINEFAVNYLVNRVYYTSKEDFYSDMDNLLYINNLLKYFAFELFIVSNDCFTKNYYFAKLSDNRFFVIPWDNDAAYGNSWVGNLELWAATTTNLTTLKSNVLFNRLMEVDSLQNLFVSYVHQFCETASDFLIPLAEQTYDQIRNDVYLDPKKKFTNAEFDQGLIEITDFLEARKVYLLGFEGVGNSKILSAKVINDLPISDSPVKFQIEKSVTEPIKVIIANGLDFSEWYFPYNKDSLDLFDDGNHSDNLSGDLIYGNEVDVTHYADDYLPVVFLNSSDNYFPYNGLFMINNFMERTFSWIINKNNSVPISENLEIGEVYYYRDNFFIELKNLSEVSLDISYCHLMVNEYFRNTAFPLGSIIPPEETIILTNNISFANNYFSNTVLNEPCYYKPKKNDTIGILSPCMNPLIQKINSAPITLNYDIPLVVINEICYNSCEDGNSNDWVEFFNPNYEAIDMSNWVFSDSEIGNNYVFPEGTIIHPRQYVVVCRYMDEFNQNYDLPFVYGDFGFNLSNSGDQLKLIDSLGVVVDSVNYSDDFPWPTRVDGDCYTLELIDYLSDNNNAGNWTDSTIYGSPGETNPSSTPDTTVLPFNFEIKNLYPNPFSEDLFLDLSIEKEDDYFIEIISSLGAIEKKYSLGRLYTGYYTIKLDNIGELQNNICFLRLSCGNEVSLQRKLVQIKK